MVIYRLDTGCMHLSVGYLQAVHEFNMVHIAAYATHQIFHLQLIEYFSARKTNSSVLAFYEIPIHSFMLAEIVVTYSNL